MKLIELIAPATWIRPRAAGCDAFALESHWAAFQLPGMEPICADSGQRPPQMQHAVLPLGYFRTCIKSQVAHSARAQT
jgi:hypothetical protein